jgi:hypothetical protein
MAKRERGVLRGCGLQLEMKGHTHRCQGVQIGVSGEGGDAPAGVWVGGEESAGKGGGGGWA